MTIKLFGYCINIFKYKNPHHVVGSWKVMRDNLDMGYLVLTDRDGYSVPCEYDLIIESRVNDIPRATVTVSVDLKDIGSKSKGPRQYAYAKSQN